MEFSGSAMPRPEAVYFATLQIRFDSAAKPMKHPRGRKSVVAFNIRIRVKPDNSGVITDGLKQSLNPFDEIALEEHCASGEGLAEEVVVVSIGPARVQNQLAHRARDGRRSRMLLASDAPLERSMRQGPAAGRAARAARAVLLGKQAIDDETTQRADARRAVGPPQARSPRR